MISRRTLLLSAASSALVSACASTPEIQPEPAALALEPTREPLIKPWGYPLEALDRTVKPGDDFFRFANGGWLVTPHLVEKPTERSWIGLKPATLRVLHQGLRQVVTNGTATMLNDPSLPPVAGKTGTAEDPPRPDHAWFGGYAPAGDPTLVIVAFGENSGGYGGTVAVPMVKALMTTWFGSRTTAAEARPRN